MKIDKDLLFFYALILLIFCYLSVVFILGTTLELQFITNCITPSLIHIKYLIGVCCGLSIGYYYRKHITEHDGGKLDG